MCAKLQLMEHKVEHLCSIVFKHMTKAISSQVWLPSIKKKKKKNPKSGK